MTPSYALLWKNAVFLFCGLGFLLVGTPQATGLDGDSALGKPPNDDFVNATAIGGRMGSVMGSNGQATQEGDEAVLFPGTSGSSLWYRWVAPGAGRWTFETTGSDFDTLLAVFTATNLADLSSTLVVSNDDVWIGTTASLVSFEAVSNVEYRIFIDGVIPDTGEVILSWLPAPANDDFANAQVIEGETGVLTGSNIGATVETNEPVYEEVPTGASVWYRWTAPRSGLVAVDTAESNFDTMLGIFTGTSLGNAVLVGANDNNSPDGTSVVWFMASAGVTYSISVNARIPAGVTDRFRLHWAFVPEVASANDDFDQAQIIAGGEGTASGLNYNATRQPGEPSHGSNTIGATLWYEWTCPADGQVIFDLACSSFNSRLALYTGESVDQLTLLTNTDVSGLGPAIVPVSSGTVYHVAVDGYLNPESYPPWLSPTGRVALHWLMIPPQPANDDFTNALPLTGLSGTVAGSNSGGGKETGETNHAANAGGASVWYRWIAPATGRFTFDMAGSGFDTLLAIYTGSTVGTLILAGQNDDQQNPLRTSSVSFNANSGTEYFIAVDGYWPEPDAVKLGRLALNWALRYPEPESPPEPEPPTLVIQPDASGQSQVISWPATNGVFVLQGATNLTPPVLWFDVSNINATAEFRFYTNDVTGAESKFFRLIKPQ